MSFDINVNPDNGEKMYVDAYLGINVRNTEIACINIDSNESKNTNVFIDIICKLLSLNEGEHIVFKTLYLLELGFNGGGVSKDFLINEIKRYYGYSKRSINRWINSLISKSSIIYVESIDLFKISTKLYYSAYITKAVVLNLQGNERASLNKLLYPKHCDTCSTNKFNK